MSKLVNFQKMGPISGKQIKTKLRCTSENKNNNGKKERKKTVCRSRNMHCSKINCMQIISTVLYSFDSYMHLRHIFKV